MEFAGRGNFQHWDDVKSHEKIPGGRGVVVESHSSSPCLLGCHGKPYSFPLMGVAIPDDTGQFIGCTVRPV